METQTIDTHAQQLTRTHTTIDTRTTMDTHNNGYAHVQQWTRHSPSMLRYYCIAYHVYQLSSLERSASDRFLPKHAGLRKAVPWLRVTVTGFSPLRSSVHRTRGARILSRVLHIPLCIYSFIRHRRCMMSVHNTLKSFV